MTIQYRGTGTSGNAVSGTTITTIVLPTGWAAGDLLFAVIRIGSSAVTGFSQTGGTGTWTIDFTDPNGAANMTSVFLHRVMVAGDTAPTFSWTTASTSCWSLGGFFSDAGGTLALDKWAAADPLDVSAGANTATPHAVTAAGPGEASIILTCCRATAAGSATSHTYTPPSGWTWNDGDGSFVAGGLNARFAANAYQLGVSGTVTPGAETLTDSTSDAFFWAVAHALVAETLPAGAGRASYAPGWHPGRGLPGLPGGVPFWVPPQSGVTAAAAVAAAVTGISAPVTVAGGLGTAAADANITGTAASVTAAAPAGTFAAAAGVTGTAAPVTVQGAAGTLASGVNVTGAAAHITAAGGAGTPSAAASITGIAAAVPVASPAGTPASGTSVTGAAALVTVQGGAGAAAGTGGGGASVTGTSATVTAAGGLGTPAAVAVITGTAAPVTVAGGAGTLSARVAITGTSAAVTAAGGTGSPNVPVNVTGVAAAVTVASPAGAPAGAAGVTGTPAPVTVAAPAGTSAAGGQVTGIAAPVTVAAPAGTVAGAAAFTVGALTAADTPGSALTTMGASATLTATTVSPAVLTAASAAGTLDTLQDQALSVILDEAGNPLS